MYLFLRREAETMMRKKTKPTEMMVPIPTYAICVASSISWSPVVNSLIRYTETCHDKGPFSPTFMRSRCLQKEYASNAFYVCLSYAVCVCISLPEHGTFCNSTVIFFVSLAISLLARRGRYSGWYQQSKQDLNCRTISLVAPGSKRMSEKVCR